MTAIARQRAIQPDSVLVRTGLLAVTAACAIWTVGCSKPKLSGKLPPDAFEFKEPVRGAAGAQSPDKSKEFKLVMARRRDTNERSFAYTLRDLKSDATLDWIESDYDTSQFTSEADSAPVTKIDWSPDGKIVVIQESAKGVCRPLPMIIEVSDHGMKNVKLPIEKWKESLGEWNGLLWANAPWHGGFTAEGYPIIHVLSRRYVYNGKAFEPIDPPVKYPPIYTKTPRSSVGTEHASKSESFQPVTPPDRYPPK